MTVSQNEIRTYWDKRAVTYTDVIKKNLDKNWEGLWAEELIRHFPEKNEISILDIGTGPGFYAIILAQRGYRVTAIDFSDGMLREAAQNAGPLKDRIHFQKMDAQNLEFPDQSFDVIVTRNLTWNLPDPKKAYHEWYRVLRPDGVMLNFDANWYAYLFDDQKKEEFLRDRNNVSESDFEDHEAYEDSDQMEMISKNLPMGRISRPDWDLQVLTELGFHSVEADTHIGERIWNPEEQMNYASTPGFMIKAVKK